MFIGYSLPFIWTMYFLHSCTCFSTQSSDCFISLFFSLSAYKIFQGILDERQKIDIPLVTDTAVYLSNHHTYMIA
jgi:hypothetical protein